MKKTAFTVFATFYIVCIVFNSVCSTYITHCDYHGVKKTSSLVGGLQWFLRNEPIQVFAHLSGADYAHALPPENATLHPQPGDIVLAYVPARMWGGSPDPVFDIGIFYGPGARMLFPIGWLAGSVVAQVWPQDRAALADACGRIRRSGACDVTFSLGA